MEQKNEIKIMTEHKTLLIELLDKWNSIYKTDFELKEFVYEEKRSYAIVSYISASLSDVYRIGRMYGEMIRRLNWRTKNL